MQLAETSPLVVCRLLGGARAIPSIVDDLIGFEAFSEEPGRNTPETLEILGLALNEVLHSINEFVGEQTLADDASVELWTGDTIIIFCVKFHGNPLPGWLIQNWDRSQEPAILAPSTDAGWGWLLVREALDGASHLWRGSQQLLFLEKRIRK